MCCANAVRRVLICGGEPETSDAGGDVVDIQTEGNTNKVWYHYIMYQLRSDSDLPIVE